MSDPANSQPQTTPNDNGGSQQDQQRIESKPESGQADSVTTNSRETAVKVPQERLFFTPPIDIYESDDGLVLEADLPGVSVESLELEVQDNKLTLFGRVAMSVPHEAVPIHQEYREGDFVRSFILSDEVDYNRITANMSNGVLKVTLPKAPQAEPRRIQVNAD